MPLKPPAISQRTPADVSEYSNARECRKINRSSACGRVAQLGEHLLCKQGVAGSIPVTSTISSGPFASGGPLTSLQFPRRLPRLVACEAFTEGDSGSLAVPAPSKT